MADDSTTPSNGLPVASDDIGGKQFQRIKLIHGVDGTNDGDVANTNGYPVKSSYTTATLQNVVSATGNGTSLSVLGMATAVLTVTGTFTATVLFEGSEDGSNWIGIVALAPQTGVLSSSTTSTGLFVVPCAGMQSIRARVSWTSGTSVTVTGHAVALTWDTASKNIAQLAGNAIDTNSGSKSAGTLRVVLATDQPALTNSLSVSNTASATGGVSAINSTSSDGGTALTSTAQAIKASAGTLQGWYIYNPNATAQFVQFYNTASGSVTVGTTNPLFMLTIPAASATNLSLTVGIAFGTAMSWSATSTAGGNGAPTTALDAVCWYA